jgi:hypothetical protein
VPTFLQQHLMPHRRSASLAVIAAVAITVGGIGSQSSEHQGDERREPLARRDEIAPETVKAVMLLKYAEHLGVTAGAAVPSGTGRPLSRVRIGVVGNDATAAAAHQRLPHLCVGNRGVAVVDVGFDDAVAGRAAGMCELLYLAAPMARERVDKVIAAYARLPLPLVCECPGFAVAGGDIQIFLETAGPWADESIKAEINQKALRGKGIHVSPQVRRLSRKAPVN